MVVLEIKEETTNQFGVLNGSFRNERRNYQPIRRFEW